MATIFVAATAAMSWGGGGDPDVREWASTNLVNLRDHPVVAMVASIFITGGGLPADAVLFVAASCVLERRAGLLRAVGIPLAGHVIATLVTEGGVRIAIWQHALPRAAAWQLDVGVSYVAFTAAAATTAYLPRRAVRIAAVAALCAWTVRPLIGDIGDMTPWGHVLCVLIGLVFRHWLPVARRGEQRPRLLAIRRGMAAATIAALAAGGVVLVAGGTQLIPASTVSDSRSARHCTVGMVSVPCERRADVRSHIAAGVASHAHPRPRTKHAAGRLVGRARAATRSHPARATTFSV
jgi:hypothetical protein